MGIRELFDSALEYFIQSLEALRSCRAFAGRASICAVVSEVYSKLPAYWVKRLTKRQELLE